MLPRSNLETGQRGVERATTPACPSEAAKAIKQILLAFCNVPYMDLEVWRIA